MSVPMYYCASCRKFIDGKPAVGNSGYPTCDVCLTPISNKPDMINHPPHYTYGPIEVLDLIEGFKLGFHAGQVIKYILRAGHKGDMVEDLKKAKFYLDRYINILERGEGKV